MEAKHSLLCSWKPITGSYPEPDESSSLNFHIYKINFNIILPSMSQHC
jgi:hypothetical protein